MSGPGVVRTEKARWPVNIKWRCLQSVHKVHNGAQCDIVPAQTRGWHLEFFTMPPLRQSDNKPWVTATASSCLCNPQRTEKICFLLNTTLLSKCAVMEFSALYCCAFCATDLVDKNAGVVTNKPLAAVYRFIYQWPWQLCNVWSGPGTKTSNNSFLSSS